MAEDRGWLVPRLTSATCNLSATAGAGRRYRHLFTWLRGRLR